MKNIHHRTLSVLGLALLAAVLLYGCAKQGYPSGGPKDETPPVVLGTTPPNGTTHFTAKEFLISFDEYVQVKSADENILVSPPMKHKPEYGTKGRGILVKIKDTLQENTTYLFQFKNGIADYNEGNLLKSFEYVFSTGSSIDSMTIRGRVLDAFTNEPRKETVTVVAYAERPQSDSVEALLPVGDSVVAKQHPLYMTRCDKEGNFELNHLREGRYLLLAYEDGDKNLRLGTDEAVAFLDTLVAAQRMPLPPDTSKHDTTAVDSTDVPDSVALADTLKVQDTLPPATDSVLSSAPTIVPVTLLMSQNKKETQRVTKSEFKRKSQIEIVTQCPTTDSLTIMPLNGSQTDLYYKRNRLGDTLQVWTAREGCDSIILVLSDTELHDTLKLQYREKKGAKPLPATLNKSSIVKGQVGASHPFFDTLWVGFENPVLDTTRGTIDSTVMVLHLTDSSVSYCGMRLAHDLLPSGSIRALIDFEGKPGEKYRFSVLPKCFTDLYGHTQSDSLHFNTEFTKTESYGNIQLDVTLEPPADSLADTLFILIQLTNEKGDKIQQRLITKSQRLTFTNLKGGKYKIRAIFDTDRNLEWTPGNYWLRRQAERVVFFEKTLELRENWDMEEKWSL